MGRNKHLIPAEQIGKVYGRLKIQSLERIVNSCGDNVYYALCSCECGNNKSILIASLRKGRSRSCGCLQKECAAKIALKTKLPLGESPINSEYADYRKSAKNRGHDFNLSKEEFRSLIFQNCFYCGDTPSRKIQTRYSHHNDFIICAGVDRRDNTSGYTVNNCVPCCEKCNRMKLCLTEEEFINHVRKITKHHETSDNRENH